MKIRCLSRNPDNHIRETKMDLFKMPRNYDPTLHPFALCREYQRALNAAKLERMFAKPFLGSLNDHKDSVTSIKRSPVHVSDVISADASGQLCCWDLSHMKCRLQLQAHDGCLRDLTYTPDAGACITVGDDKTIKRWSLTGLESGRDEGAYPELVPVSTVHVKDAVTSVSHMQANEEKFATCGETCQIWETHRIVPLKVYSWGNSSMTCVRFNPIERNVLGACTTERNIILYDIRANEPLRKVTTQLRSSVLSWNPMGAFYFTCANEDYNLYTWDMRRLNRPVLKHEGHVLAVTDVDYSPTGSEFVSGGYDKTLRIFSIRSSQSRDIYHTRRMQRVTAVCWSSDDKYVLSGSIEMNIRLWKASASQNLSAQSGRQVAALDYHERLLDKFAMHPQVRRVRRHRQVPRHVLTTSKQLKTSSAAKSRREANLRAHSRPGTVPDTPLLDRHVLAECS